MLQEFAMVKYGVFVAKICKYALCASTVRDIWWSPLARQLLPACLLPITTTLTKAKANSGQLEAHSPSKNIRIVISWDRKETDWWQNNQTFSAIFGGISMKQK